MAVYDTEFNRLKYTMMAEEMKERERREADIRVKKEAAKKARREEERERQEAAELKVTTYNWPLGEGFVMEMTLLYGSFAFLMWQVTTLSGFKGLSFDLSVA